jgi:hypothetical protein
MNARTSDNMKALFCPVAMMVSDHRMNAKNELYSLGFEEVHPLSEKIAATFRFRSE